MSHLEIDYSLWQFIKDLWRYIRPYKIKFFVAFFLRITSDIALLYPIWAFSQIVALITAHPSTQGFAVQPITFLLVGWFLAVVYRGAVHNLCKYWGFQVAERASLDLLKDSMRHLLTLDFNWHEEENSGNKMKRIDKGQDGVDDIIRQFFVVMVEVSVNTVGIVLFLFTLQKFLSLALVFFIITYYIIGTILLKKAIYQENVVNALAEDMYGFIFETLNNIRTIKSLSLNFGVMKVIGEKALNLIQEIRKRIFWYQTQGGVLNTYALVFEVTVVSIICWGIWRGFLNVSLLILFVGLFQRVEESTRELTDVTQNVVKDQIGVARAMEILRKQPNIENPALMKQQVSYPQNWQTLKIEHLSFQYHKTKILEDISLSIQRGEKIGIVGLSGAGKSTLFKLLLDLYEDYDGEIFLDDASLKKMNRQSYIDHVAVVLQDTELFNMSLKGNIEIAGVENKSLTDPQFNEVLEQAHLNEVIEILPQGVETVVGEKGIKLSGGQRQRVGIARALYRQPDILLFDEATSHLDVHSEKFIQHALYANFNTFTTIVIAHRLSTIKEMDKIVVLEKGRVKEVGTFAELIARKGSFAKMWQAQKL